MTQFDVLKFGGTSLADTPAFERCLQIIKSGSSSQIIVVSASAGVTQHLVELAKGIKNKEERQRHISLIEGIQSNILNGLTNPHEIKVEIKKIIEKVVSLSEKIAKNPSPKLSDAIQALGEQMSSHLLVEFLNQAGLNSQYFDARTLIITDDNYGHADPQLDEIKKRVQAKTTLIQDDLILVTQGFIGSTITGDTTTLGRGGSDYSAALIAEASGAKELQIWTDVCGIFSTDPRIESKAKPIPEISFNEAAEMATFGAKILHPKTLWPAVRANIPIFVGSSREPKIGGTRISPNAKKKSELTAVALRQDQTLLTLTSFNMLHSSGFLAKVFNILASHKISVDLVTTSEVSVSLTFDQFHLDGNLHKNLLDDLKELGDLKIDKNLALIALIGNGLTEKAGIATLIFSELAEFNLRLICHGASQHNICFLVDQNISTQVVRRIHSKILEGKI